MNKSKRTATKKDCTTCCYGPRTTLRCRECYNYNDWKPQTKVPACRLCGDTGKPCTACREFHGPHTICPPHEVRMRGLENEPCPGCGAIACPPAQVKAPKAGDFVKKARKKHASDKLTTGVGLTQLEQMMPEACDHIDRLKAKLTTAEKRAMIIKQGDSIKMPPFDRYAGVTTLEEAHQSGWIDCMFLCGEILSRPLKENK